MSDTKIMNWEEFQLFLDKKDNGAPEFVTPAMVLIAYQYAVDLVCGRDNGERVDEVAAHAMAAIHAHRKEQSYVKH